MNLSYLDWYLVELRRRLHDSLPLDHENSFTLETRNHLESLAEEFEGLGMDRRSAEIAAIERFGSPDAIASDCLLGYRRTRERRLIQISGLVLAMLITLVVMSEMGYGNGMPYPYALSAVLAPLIVFFALFALILGRMPSWKWFAFPALLMVPFGFISGYLNTAYSTPVSNGGKRSYAILHDQYRQLRVLNVAASGDEHVAAESWRKAISSATDLGKNQMIEVPRIVYQEQRLPHSNYSGATVRHYSYAAAHGTIYDWQSGKESFRYLPVRSNMKLVGPLTAHDVRKTLNARINEVRENSAMRSQILGSMSQALNTPVIDRIRLFLQAQLVTYAFQTLPASLILCFFLSKVRNRIRFKGSRLRLA